MKTIQKTNLKMDFMKRILNSCFLILIFNFSFIITSCTKNQVKEDNEVNYSLTEKERSESKYKNQKELFEEIRPDNSVIKMINFYELFYKEGCEYKNDKIVLKYFYNGEEYHEYGSYCKDKNDCLVLIYLYMPEHKRLVNRITESCSGPGIISIESL